MDSIFLPLQAEIASLIDVDPRLVWVGRPESSPECMIAVVPDHKPVVCQLHDIATQFGFTRICVNVCKAEDVQKLLQQPDPWGAAFDCCVATIRS